MLFNWKMQVNNPDSGLRIQIGNPRLLCIHFEEEPLDHLRQSEIEISPHDKLADPVVISAIGHGTVRLLWYLQAILEHPILGHVCLLSQR